MAFLVARLDVRETLHSVIKRKVSVMYSQGSQSKVWYQSVNNAELPALTSNRFNALPKQSTPFKSFADNIDTIGDILKFGLEKGYVSNERISEILKIDSCSHAGMDLLSDVIVNDFWRGFSKEVGEIQHNTEQRYLSVMPDHLKDDFIAQSKRCLGYHSLNIGKNPYCTYEVDKFYISIDASEPYLSSFDLSKYQFNKRTKQALMTIINKLMLHQFECPPSTLEQFDWVFDELFDENETVIFQIADHCITKGDSDIDIDILITELELETYREQIEMAGVREICQSAYLRRLMNEIDTQNSTKSLTNCFTDLDKAAKKEKDSDLALISKMAQFLPKVSNYSVLSSEGDIDMAYSAIYTFDSYEENQLAESIFEQTYQTGEEPTLMLEPSESGLCFLKNYFEALYLKSLIFVVLEHREQDLVEVLR